MALRKIKILLDMIKFEHTIFALPFAYLGMVLGARGLPSFSTLLWITCAMVGARSYAMALNRICDRTIDKKNPRTRHWALPAGLVKTGEAALLGGAALALFFIAVFMLPPLCHVLWPFVLLPMTVYPLTKRFTMLCHLLLGSCLGLAPLGAWVATTNTMPHAGILLLGLGVLFWTAGFDILYSCQDVDFDRREALHSIPARYGIARALTITRILHCGTVLCLLAMGLCFSLGAVFYAGVVVVGGFLWYENSILSPTDLSRMNVSFFTVNGLVSICAFLFTSVSIIFHL